MAVPAAVGDLELCGDAAKGGDGMSYQVWLIDAEGNAKRALSPVYDVRWKAEEERKFWAGQGMWWETTEIREVKK